MLTLINKLRRSGCSSTAAAKQRANRAAGPKSPRARLTRLNEIAGTPNSEASIAAATGPEQLTSSARFGPWLIPDTINAGRPSFIKRLIARDEQSLGGP